MKKYLIILISIFLLNCNKKEVFYFPNGSKNYEIAYQRDKQIITVYEGRKNALMEITFKNDHFSDTIFYWDKPYKHYIVVDSLADNYFFGTETILYANKKPHYKARYRYKKSKDFKEVINSMMPYKYRVEYDDKGNVKRETKFIIVKDSLFFYEVR